MENPTDIRHIESTPGVCGGKPRIAGHRVRVQDIYVLHELEGQTPDAILQTYPGITLADVHAAMAYYWDHREVIQRQMKEDDEFVRALQGKSAPVPVDVVQPQESSPGASIPSR